MKRYYHPPTGEVYYERESFEWDYAITAAGVSGLGAGVGIGALSRNATYGLIGGGLSCLIVGGLIGKYYPKMLPNWFNPPPEFQPYVMPREIPKVIVPSFIRDEDLVGNWLFYVGAGDTLHDFSGKGNHGTIYGTSWQDGSYGWALSFDGDDYVDCENVMSSGNISTQVTVELWVNLKEIPTVNHAGLVGFGGTGKWHYFHILQNTTKPRIAICGDWDTETTSAKEIRTKYMGLCSLYFWFFTR